MLKEQAEVNGCTFQPELITSNSKMNSSITSSVRKRRNSEVGETS
jgi:hypothetical protein